MTGFSIDDVLKMSLMVDIYKYPTNTTNEFFISADMF